MPPQQPGEVAITIRGRSSTPERDDPTQTLFPSTAPSAPPTTDTATARPESLFPPRDARDPLTRAVTVPDPQAARILDLRTKTGLAPEVIRRNLDRVEREAARDDFDPVEFRRRAPTLAGWLQEDPLRAAAVQPALPSMVQLDNALTWGATLLRSWDQLQSGTGAFLEATGELTGIEGLARYGGAVRTFNQQQADALGKRTGFWQAIAHPAELGQYVKETIGEQVPIMGTFMAGSAAGAAIGGLYGTAIPIPVVGTVSGATLGAIIGAAFPAFVLGVGEVQSDIKAIDPTARAPVAAFVGGSAVAAFDTFLPGHLGSRLVSTFGRETAEKALTHALLQPVAPRFLRSMGREGARDLATEAITEAIQEGIGAVAAAHGTGTDLPADLWKSMVEAGVAGGLVGGVSGASVEASTHARRSAAFAAAEQQRVIFDALAKGVTDLPPQLTEQGRAFLAQATKNGPIETTYVPTAAWDEVFQTAGVDPAMAAAEITGRPDALAEAKRNGVDLAIPTADYAAKLAATEHHAGLVDELRLGDPRMLNAREARELTKRLSDTAEAVEGSAQPETEPARQAIHQQVRDQGVEAGLRRDVADAWGQVWSTRYIERARILGVDPAVLFESAPPPRLVSDAPLPSPDRASSVVLPPSESTRNETPAIRERRRTLHVAAVARVLTEDAQRQDPAVTEADIKAELAFRLSMEEERQQAARETGRGQDLLRAIAEHGGFKIAEDAEHRGELAHFASARDPHEQGKPRSWNGVAGVFDVEGTSRRSQSVRAMMTALREDPRFAYLEGDFNALLDAVDEALRAPRDLDRLPGTADLHRLGIVPGTPWWRDSWRAPAEAGPVEPSDSVDTGEGEIGEFGPEGGEGVSKVEPPDEVFQREQTSAPPTDRAAYQSRQAYDAQLRATYVDGDRQTASSRTTPQTAAIPPVGTWLIDDSFAALDGHEIEQLVEVKVGNIEISEDTGRARFADVEQYARWQQEGKEPPPIRVVQTDKGTLKTLDHRRLLAAKALGADTIKAWVSWATTSNRPGSPTVGLTFELAQEGARPLPITAANPDNTIFRDDAALLDDLRARMAGQAKYAAARAAVRQADAITPTDDELFQRVAAAAVEPGTDWVYSRLVRAVESSKTERASGSQWKATIRNAKSGINLDEYLVVGVDELVDSQVYTREEVLAYLRDHQVRVETVTFGESGESAAFRESRIIDRADAIYDRRIQQAISDIAEHEEENDRGPRTGDVEYDEDDDVWRVRLQGWEHDRPFETEAEAQKWLEQAEAVERDNFDEYVREQARERESYDDALERAREEFTDEGTPAHFATYVEQGPVVEGSYREVFLTAPQGGGPQGFTALTREENAVLRAAYPSLGRSIGVMRPGTRQRQALETWLDNVHGRVEARDPDILYSVDLPEHIRILKKLLASADHTYRENVWEDGHSEYGDVENPIVRLRVNQRVSPDGRRVLFLEEVQPPREDQFAKMPPLFQKQWRELAFKWALRQAAELNLDAVAWTTGQMQTDRYKLTKAVERIEWQGVSALTDEGYADAAAPRREVRVYPRDGHGQHFGLMVDRATGKVVEATTQDAEAFVGHTLSEVVGESLATRIREEHHGLTTPADLQVGGEGLARLYDVDLPNAIKALPVVKRSDAKIGSVAIKTAREGPGGGTYSGPTRTIEELRHLAASDPELADTGIEDVVRALEQGATFVAAMNEATTRLATALGGTFLSPNDIISKPVRALPITADLRARILEGQALFQTDDEKGDIRGAFSPSANTIRLIAGKASLDTLLHEAGHAFLEELAHDAALVGRTGATTPEQERLVADMQAVLRWTGFAGTVEEWRALPIASRRDSHEQWAEAFQDYLFTGKAPSPELRTLFARFRTWLAGMYKVLRRQPIELPAEIRGVMDRLLASEEAIAAAEAESRVTPLFTDAASAGVDEATFARYQHAIEQAHRAAQEDVDRRILADWRKEQRADYQQQRDIVRKAVITELQQQPVFRAQAVMRTGKLPDGTIPDYGDGRPMKLRKSEVIQQFGKATLDRLPRPYLYAVEGGLPIEQLTAQFGFGSPDALIQALIAAPRLERVIESETDQRMREEHADLLVEPRALRELAEEAVHTERAALIAQELETLTRGMTAAAIPRPDQLKAAAEAQIAKTPIRQLKPGLYLQAVVRASQQAFDVFAKNDRTAAIAAKRQELVSLSLYRAARDAKEQWQVHQRALTKFATHGPTRARLAQAGQDYLDQVDAYLERFDFTKLSDKAIARRQSLRSWVDKLNARPDAMKASLPDDVLDDARRIHWRELTVEELAGVHDAVQMLAHLARLKGRLLRAAKQRELAVIDTTIAKSIADHAQPRRAQRIETELASERLRQGRVGWVASHRKMANLAYLMDGHTFGPLWEYVVRAVNAASDGKATRQASATQAVTALFESHYTAEQRTQLFTKEYIPALGPPEDPNASLSKMGRIMMALNWGNETNRQRLTSWYQWTDDQVTQTLDTLDKRDMDFVQGVWDYIETYWPEIAEHERLLTGVVPTKVEATPVYTRFGEYRGGYFPLKSNRKLFARSAAHQDAGFLDLHKAAVYTAATTKRNHVQERAEADVTYPVRLDFGVVIEHLGEVIHDLTHRAMLVDVGRILNGEKVKKAFYDHYGEDAYRIFLTTLRDVAIGDVPAQEYHDRIANHLRTGATIVGLGLNMTSAAVQIAGFSNTVYRLGWRATWDGIAAWAGRGGPREQVHSVREIHRLSPFMAMRASTMNRELNEIKNRITAEPTRVQAWFDFGVRAATFNKFQREDLIGSYFYFIGGAQMLVDVPTWLGAYRQALADPANVTDAGDPDEARAIAIADQQVRDTQTSGEMAYLSMVQKGGPWKKLWTNFYSPMNTTLNLFLEAIHAQGGKGIAVGSVGLFAADFLLHTAPATIGFVIREAMRGNIPDDDDDWKDAAWRLAVENVNYRAGTLFLIRDVVQAATGPFGFEGPAGTRPLASAARAGRQIYRALEEWDYEKAMGTGARAFAQTAGAFLHVPSAQLLRTYDGFLAWLEGRTTNPAALLVGPPREED